MYVKRKIGSTYLTFSIHFEIVEPIFFQPVPDAIPMENCILKKNPKWTRGESCREEK